MPQRRDALAAAAEMTVTIESLVRENASPDLVGTVGTLDVHPGAINSIPSRVQFTLDLRDIDGDNRDAVLQSITTDLGRITRRRRVSLEQRVLNADPPATADAGVGRRRLGPPWRRGSLHGR